MIDSTWYQFPIWGWGVLLVSVISLMISFISLRRSSRVSLSQSLFRQQIQINEAFMRHTVRSPFATILNVPDDQLAIYTGKAGLLNL